MPTRPSTPWQDISTVFMLAFVMGLFCSDISLAVPVPLAPPQDASPVAPTLLARQHRFAEAETKARLYAKLSRAEADKTPNMDLYDVIHYDLDLELDPVLRQLQGTVTMTARVTGTGLNQVDLHLILVLLTRYNKFPMLLYNERKA